jgi:hypothetical protein
MIWKYNGEVKFLARMEDNYYSDLAYRWAPIHYQYVNHYQKGHAVFSKL